MKILAFEVEQPGTTAADFAPLLEAEARDVWQHQQAGLVREIYFRADQKPDVLVLECDGLEDATQHVEQLPLANAGLIAFDLIPLAPYTGYERLFGIAP